LERSVEQNRQILERARDERLGSSAPSNSQRRENTYSAIPFPSTSSWRQRNAGNNQSNFSIDNDGRINVGSREGLR
jgi:hypothetical protein